MGRLGDHGAELVIVIKTLVVMIVLDFATAQ